MVDAGPDTLYVWEVDGGQRVPDGRAQHRRGLGTLTMTRPFGSGNILADVPPYLADEQVLDLVAAPGIRITRVVSTGHVTDWQDPDEDEWVLVLQGSGTLLGPIVGVAFFGLLIIANIFAGKNFIAHYSARGNWNTFEVGFLPKKHFFEKSYLLNIFVSTNNEELKSTSWLFIGQLQVHGVGIRRLVGRNYCCYCTGLNYLVNL